MLDLLLTPLSAMSISPLRNSMNSSRAASSPSDLDARKVSWVSPSGKSRFLELNQHRAAVLVLRPLEPGVCQLGQGRSSRFDQYGNGRTNNYGRKINFSRLSVGELRHYLHYSDFGCKYPTRRSVRSMIRIGSYHTPYTLFYISDEPLEKCLRRSQGGVTFARTAERYAVFKKVPVRYRPNAASGSVAVGGVRIISALSQASYAVESLLTGSAHGARTWLIKYALRITSSRISGLKY